MHVPTPNTEHGYEDKPALALGALGRAGPKGSQHRDEMQPMGRAPPSQSLHPRQVESPMLHLDTRVHMT